MVPVRLTKIESAEELDTFELKLITNRDGVERLITTPGYLLGLELATTNEFAELRRKAALYDAAVPELRRRHGLDLAMDGAVDEYAAGHRHAIAGALQLLGVEPNGEG